MLFGLQSRTIRIIRGPEPRDDARCDLRRFSRGLSVSAPRQRWTLIEAESEACPRGHAPELPHHLLLPRGDGRCGVLRSAVAAPQRKIEIRSQTQLAS